MGLQMTEPVYGGSISYLGRHPDADRFEQIIRKHRLKPFRGIPANCSRCNADVGGRQVYATVEGVDYLVGVVFECDNEHESGRFMSGGFEDYD